MVILKLDFQTIYSHRKIFQAGPGSHGMNLSDLFIAAQVSEDNLVWSRESAFVSENFSLTVSTPVSEGRVRFTLDGTDPMTSASARWGQGGVSIDVDPASTAGRNATPVFFVTACVTHADTLISDRQTRSWIFKDRILELSPDGVVPESFAISDALKIRSEITGRSASSRSWILLIYFLGTRRM